MNVQHPRLFTLSGNEIEVRLEQLLNPHLPILVIPSGMVTEVNLKQLWSILSLIFEMPAPINMLVREKQLENAASPMLVTLSGIETETRLLSTK